MGLTRLALGGMFGKRGFALIALLTLLGLPVAVHALTPPYVTVTPSVASPQMVGTPVTFTAKIIGSIPTHIYSYQFSVTHNGQTQLLSDFSPVSASFTWVPHTVEGVYQFTATVRDTSVTPYQYFAPATIPFQLTPWVSTPLAPGVVNPTSHPLIALFSGPPCTVGHQLLVRFRPAAPTGTQSGNSMTTNLVACSPQSANFYVAGMYPTSQYLMHWEEYSGTTLVNTGSDLPFTTGSIPATVPAEQYPVTVPAQASDAAYPLTLFQTGNPAAVDLSGNVIWYFSNQIGLSLAAIAMSRMEPGGNFYSYPPTLLIEYDLAGNVVKQTNVEIMNEQLAAQGYPTMTVFNGHEARNLPDGNIALLGSRVVTSTSAQGGTPTKPVKITGDMVLVVNQNLQLVWAWDSFAHQNINRAATLGDIASDGSNDWLHTNALQGTADGNIIISERSQDMVIKINYDRGKGDGSTIWQMGAGLDFTIVNPPSGSCSASTIPGDPNILPWFTHQHDAHFDFEDDASGSGYMVFSVFDDGNTRATDCSGVQHSRGMVLLVDEAARQIYIETAADLGSYSAALGSAQLLVPGSGNLYANFNSGYIDLNSAQVSEANLTGQILYQIGTNQLTYRAYRMPNLYTPTEFETTSGFQGALPTGVPFDFSSGFAQNQDAVATNGNSSVLGNVLQLTDGGLHEASSAFYGSPVNVQTFTTDFTFQQTNAQAGGFTFTIQNAGPNAIGILGAGLGYEYLGDSAAIKFDLYSNDGEGPNSTGLYIDGAIPTVPAIDLTGTGINLHSGDMMDAHITYDGTTLTLTITDLVTMAVWSHPFAINIPGTIGGPTAYIGFTASSGDLSSTQQILTWSYEPGYVPYQSAGFSSAAGLIANGSASVSGNAVQLTDGGLYETGSAYYGSPINIQSFTSDFNFQQTNAQAGGFTFTIQNAGANAVGYSGAGLGYESIAKSVAIKFDLYNNSGEGPDSTGLYLDGAIPTVPAIDLTGTGINLHSGDMMHAHLSYDGTALTLTITDLSTNAMWTQPFDVDIPGVVGGKTAYAGFTASTGGMGAIQKILNWTFE